MDQRDRGTAIALLTVETSRSSIVDREECDRLRLLAWDLDGTGYSLRASSVAILSGIHIHEGFATLLEPGTDPWDPARLDTAVAVMLDGYTKAFHAHGLRQAEGEDANRILMEQRWMLEMMLRGWVRVRMPAFLEEYEVMSVERAWRWELAPGIILPLRMDAIVRRRDDGLLHVVDFKGTGSGDDNFVLQHEKSRQTLLYLTALEEHTDEPVGGMVYEGLVRGAFRVDTAKGSPFFGQRIQNSPLTYAYCLRGEDGMDQWTTNYTRAKGWARTAVWNDHTPEEWLDFLASEKDKEGRVVLEKMFIPGVPVSPPPAFRQSSRRQIAIKEREYILGLQRFNDLRATFGSDEHPVVQAHLEAWATQKTQRCNKYGADNKCPFAAGDLCFMTNATEVLKDDAAFGPRIPHHAPALEVS